MPNNDGMLETTLNTYPKDSLAWQAFNHGFMFGMQHVEQDLLSARELQFLTKVLARSISCLETSINYQKQYLAIKERMCDKQDAETLEYYKEYKQLLGQYRRSKRQKNKLAMLQSKLKKLLAQVQQ